MGVRPAYLAALDERVLVFDGAMGTSIQAIELTAEDFDGREGCNDVLVLTRPDVISAIHSSFLEVGCDVVETDTFNATRLRLSEYGLGERTHDINLAAARLARAAADRHATPEKPRFVAGSMGPTGMLPSSDDPMLGAMLFADLVEIYREQAAALIEGGVDLLIIETSQDILELKAAVTGSRLAMQATGCVVPIQTQVTLDTSGRMLMGTDIGAAMVIMEAMRADVIGLNCSTGPELMREPVRYLTEYCTQPISVIPNAGIPRNVAVRPCTQCCRIRWPSPCGSLWRNSASTWSAAAAVPHPSTCAGSWRPWGFARRRHCLAGTRPCWRAPFEPSSCVKCPLR